MNSLFDRNLHFCCKYYYFSKIINGFVRSFVCVFFPNSIVGTHKTTKEMLLVRPLYSYVCTLYIYTYI